MDQAHARRMMDCLTVSTPAAAQALEAGRLVYAVETPDGSWGQVERIEPFTAKGRRTQVWSVVFASGKTRVFQRGGTFWVERERSAVEYGYTGDEVPGT